MRVFVTGAFGYVGGAVAALLEERGARLSVLVRDDVQTAAAEARGWQPVPGGLEAVAALATAAGAAEAIVHAAASDDPRFLPVNEAAIDAMIGAARDGAGFVVHAGTLLFGPTGNRILDGTEPLQPPPFLADRARLDARMMAAGARLRLSSVAAALVHGGTGAAVPRAMMTAARALGAVPVPPPGPQIWSTVHVADWARLIVRALERGAVGSRRYVAAAGETRIDAFAETLAGLMGLDTRPADAAALSALGPFGAALQLDQRFTGARAADELGWAPTRTDLAAGLAELLS